MAVVQAAARGRKKQSEEEKLFGQVMQEIQERQEHLRELHALGNHKHDTRFVCGRRLSRVRLSMGDPTQNGCEQHCVLSSMSSQRVERATQHTWPRGLPLLLAHATVCGTGAYALMVVARLTKHGWWSVRCSLQNEIRERVKEMQMLDRMIKDKGKQ